MVSNFHEEDTMRKLFALLMILLCLITISGCAEQEAPPEVNIVPAYQEKTISESYNIVPEEPAATFNASYPVFDGSRYRYFNEAIVKYEVAEWERIYSEICAQADIDQDADPGLATFHRYLNVTYSVKMVGEDLEVTFQVEWMLTLCNYEPKYERIYTYSDGMMYATTTTTERIY
jgi:hypothetical protein